MIGETDTGIIAEGKDGANGKDGADGATPEITIDNTNHAWVINGKNTGVKAVGQDGLSPYISADNHHWIAAGGDTGVRAIGIDGENGKDGITPTIKNGNWYFGENDSGVRAEGLKGDKGDVGEPVYVEDVSSNGTYKLKFKDIDKEIITPNLKGMDGTTADIYSTEETHIGTWIDGFPLYRKVIKIVTDVSIGDLSDVIDYTVPHGVSDIKEIISCLSSRHQAEKSIFLPYPNNKGYSSAVIIVDGENIVFRIQYEDFFPGTWYFIIEYTKENDTPKILRPVTFPIGYIYMSVDPTNPGEIFGGEWTAFSQGRVLMGVSESDADFNEVEKTGGEKTHTLTINEMPSHSHNIFPDIALDSNGVNSRTGNYSKVRSTSDPGSGSSLYLISAQSSGGGGAHNNIPPYITVYMWKRIA